MSAIELVARAIEMECPPEDLADTQSRRMFALVPTTIILILSILTYALRLYCRRKTGQGVKLDDYLMGVGLTISIMPAICEYLLLQNGLGYHFCRVPPKQKARFAVINFALQRANQPALACIKVSILLFYLRLFSNTKAFRIAAYVNIGYTIAWAISTWIVNLMVCTPVAYYYDRTIPGGHCSNQAISGSVNGGLSLLGDVAILVLPIPVIWGLKMNKRRKIGIIAILMLGAFTCVASVIRIVELSKFVVTDPTYSQVFASTWTTLEMGVAVISGNLPLLAPLFENYFRNRGTSKDCYGAHYGSHYGSSGPSSRLHRNGTSKGDPSATITSVGRQDNFTRLSDTESEPHNGSVDFIELDDRAILVSTKIVVRSQEDVRAHQPDIASKTDVLSSQGSRGWRDSRR